MTKACPQYIRLQVARSKLSHLCFEISSWFLAASLVRYIEHVGKMLII